MSPETSTAHPVQEIDSPGALSKASVQSVGDRAWNAGSEAIESLRSEASCCDRNISKTEQWGSILAGAALVATGLRRGKIGGALLGLIGGSLIYRGATGHCYSYQMLGIDTSEDEPSLNVYPGQPRAVSDQNPPLGVASQRGEKIEATVTVNRSAEDLYQFWRDVENLPRVMSHIQNIEAIDGTHSRWTAEGPLGKSVHWESEIFNERKPEMISWRSMPDSEVATAGSVHFRPLGGQQATEVTVELKYDPPAGQAGATVASWLGSDPQQMLEEDLQRLKTQLETNA